MKHLVRWSLLITTLLVFHSWILDQTVWIAETAHFPDTASLVRAFGALVGAPALLGFLLFSRIDESRAMDNPSRQRLREAIRAAPGLSLSELQQRVGLGWGTTVYHLNRMERVGLVASTDVGRRRAFFLAEHNHAVRDLTKLMSNGAHVRLMAAVRANPNMSQQELATAAGLSLPLANRYLQRLEADGLVRSTKEWRVRRYEATDRPTGSVDLDKEGPLAAAPSGPLPLRPQLSPRGTNAP